MSTDLSRDDQALLEDLESLFGAHREESAPSDFLVVLKAQVGDRLAPDRMSVGETMAITVIAVSALAIGLGGALAWSPIELLSSAVAIWLFVRAAHWFGTARAASE
jgi:hypothetical protein